MLKILTFIISAILLLPACAVGRNVDFDGDGVDDLVVYHSATGHWFVLPGSGTSMLVMNWGWRQTQPVPGDYDGDGKADFCVFHARSGNWYLVKSSDGTVSVINWGWSKVIPVPGDYDGDGKIDMAVYDPFSYNWYILPSASGVPYVFNWGWAGAIPVPGDYEGNGICNPAVFNPETGDWFILTSTGKLRLQNWGWAGTVPVPGDYDGDGIEDLAIYDPVSHVWYMQRSSDAGMTVLLWGMESSQPVPGDYDGDGITDPAVFVPETGHWLINLSSESRLKAVRWGWDATEPALSSIRTYMNMYPESHDYGSDYYDRRPVVPENFSGVKWLHTDVSQWQETASLSVRITSSQVVLDYDKAGAWPSVYTVGAHVVANPWIFVSDGKGGWYAATWEWMRPGQKSKARSAVAGDHIKVAPLHDFKPVPGEWYGFMVSGLARSSVRNVMERSNVVMIQWPEN